jgi:hypothetical protein
MFALSTAYWILSVVLTFGLADSWGGGLRVCYDQVRASACIAHVLAHRPRGVHLPIFDDTILINVSIIHHRVLASYHYIIRKSVN